MSRAQVLAGPSDTLCRVLPRDSEILEKLREKGSRVLSIRELAKKLDVREREMRKRARLQAGDRGRRVVAVENLRKRGHTGRLQVTDAAVFEPDAHANLVVSVLEPAHFHGG